MKKTFFLFTLVAMLATTFVGCTTASKSNEISGAKLSNFVDIRALTRKDYKVMAVAKGEASYTRTRVLVFVYYSFGWLGLSDKRDAGTVSGHPTSFTPLSPYDYTKDQAIYNALEKLEGADALLQPRFKTKCEANQYLLYSSETCTITVTGKAITVNEG